MRPSCRHRKVTSHLLLGTRRCIHVHRNMSICSRIDVATHPFFRGRNCDVRGRRAMSINSVRVAGFLVCGQVWRGRLEFFCDFTVSCRLGSTRIGVGVSISFACLPASVIPAPYSVCKLQLKSYWVRVRCHRVAPLRSNLSTEGQFRNLPLYPLSQRYLSARIGSR